MKTTFGVEYMHELLGVVNLKRYIAILLIAAGLVSLCACTSEEIETTRKEDAVATVSAVGDIYLSESMLADAKQPDGSYDFSTQLEPVIVPLSRADVTFGNFEGNFTGASYSAERASYPNELAAELSRVGFDLLQTANSFSIFNGVSGLEYTKEAIESQGMRALGTYVNEDDRRDHQVIIREVNGIRIAFVAFTKGVGNLTIPDNASCSVDLLYKDYTSDYSEINTEYITSVLSKAADEEPDVIIAALHWGSENNDQISQTQEEITELMLKNGVDVILGSHPHIVGPIERRSVTLENGLKKECVIAYSLGDFCIADAGQCNTSLILDLEFTRTGNQTVISHVGYTPISAIDRGEGYADRYRVVITQAEVEMYESNYFDHVSEALYEEMLTDLESIRKKLETEE